MSLRWGILGTGYIAGLQTEDLRLADIQVLAVGSRSAKTAQDFAAKHQIPRAYGSYQELVADPDVEVIYVASPNPAHLSHALLALNAGKHVLVEKPFTLNALEARQIFAVAEKNGKVALEAMWTRLLPHMVRIREIIAEGIIGTPLTLVADHSQALPADPRHRVQAPDLGGGALLDLGIYPISFAWDLFGAPSSIQAISTPTATGVDARTSVLLGYSSGAHAALHTQLDARGPVTATIIGSAGRIEIDSFWYMHTDFRVYKLDNTLVENYLGRDAPGRGMQHQALAFERVLSTGDVSHAPVSPEETLAIMGTLDTIRRQIDLSYPGE